MSWSRALADRALIALGGGGFRAGDCSCSAGDHRRGENLEG